MCCLWRLRWEVRLGRENKEAAGVERAEAAVAKAGECHEAGLMVAAELIQWF